MKKEIYLDYAATTPMSPIVEKAMRPFLGLEYGNPSSLHTKGVVAKRAIESSRTTIARLLKAKPQEIVFTAGGTESCNLAILGAAKAFEKSKKHKGHIITSAIEHHAVLEPILALKRGGWKVTILPVDSEGFVTAKQIRSAIKPETVLVSVMLANNEVGTTQPVAQIGRMLKEINAKRARKILFHTDACQAPGYIALDVQKLGVDLLSANGSKLCGPKQTGFLFVRQGAMLEPLLYGGGQERGLRSGTENVSGIVGLGVAFSEAQKHAARESVRLSTLRDYFTKLLLQTFEGATLNGPWLWLDTKKSRNKEALRLANNISITFPDIEGEALMLYLDAHHIAVSTGSACSTGKPDPSHVLKALGKSEYDAKNTIRFSLGSQTTKKDLDTTLAVLKKLIPQLKKLTKLSPKQP
jgi:cysteine desulfurase